MGSHRVFTTSTIPPSAPRVQVQEASLALLSIRLVLLREHPQLPVPLGLPLQRTAMGGVLLFVPWVSGQRCYHLEEQSGVP